VFLDHGLDPNTPFLLHDAALKGHLPLVKLLLEKGADPKRRNGAGATPLHDAALAGHAVVARLLPERGAPLNDRETETGATPLHLAASWGRTAVVEALMEMGADPGVPNKAGQTPLAAARANGHSEAAALLDRRN
jgi:ankyrin repeat protein